MTPKFSGIYSQALVQAGLSQDQACVYELLLQRGPSQAGSLPRLMQVSRPHIYKVLGELIELGLATKEDLPGKPSLFVPVHPFALQELLRKQRMENEIASQTMEGVMSSLVSEFTTSSNIPGIRIGSGLNGLKDLYADILREKQDICLIRSTKDDDEQERMDLVLKQISRQVALGINTRLIGPAPYEDADDLADLAAQDRKRLTTRRVFEREEFTLPAQVIIYNNTVGITDYEGALMTTIIENAAIAATLKAVFELLWSTAKPPY